MKFLGVIPARYASTRLEGKPLISIEGQPMIEWVYKRTLASSLDKVVVATDDKRIFDAVISFGGEAVMTSPDHTNGTSRIAEVAAEYEDYDVIINVQGDEPLIEGAMIDALIEPFRENHDLVMATLKHKIDNYEEVENPNNVKVITDNKDFAIYFSRSPIPYPRTLDMKNYYKHVGIYGYKRDFVIEYSKMIPTDLEISESLEQLRVIENGYKIKVLDTPYKVIGVDTSEDLAKVEKIIRDNNIKI
ncbi:3-deoxy-manno-octulosonate cytidylyltransferase [Ilyobacter polytropus]|uniref:3-deoxy-manno-octulosonate cytidylyltransferase n=1 Tax=Ilyobacter polytropus (strain ATCC 51220 / DSM 2926 / LMG 16218 / CuHBu1) TaxID=572544 RepID=E3H7G0_ILYPC|nr:3-deoxy-manno-octulosonate cytidylyltransferase [Ilyobacter polytropus]ADO82856.1 3-deoxy-D-manno-octulosonatecytidylyltransferase [Ilyobacter polytropus DSM 2926]